MNTPRTDAQVFVASGGQQVAPLEFTRQLETQVQELRRVVAKCNAEFKAMALLGMGDMKEAIEDTAAVLERTK